MRAVCPLQVVPVFPSIPGYYNIESPGLAGYMHHTTPHCTSLHHTALHRRPEVGGQYRLLANITERSAPVYRQQGLTGLLLFQVTALWSKGNVNTVISLGS
jgi:hypothetical protein